MSARCADCRGARPRRDATGRPTGRATTSTSPGGGRRCYPCRGSCPRPTTTVSSLFALDLFNSRNFGRDSRGPALGFQHCSAVGSRRQHPRPPRQEPRNSHGQSHVHAMGPTRGPRPHFDRKIPKLQWFGTQMLPPRRASLPTTRPLG